MKAIWKSLHQRVWPLWALLLVLVGSGAAFTLIQPAVFQRQAAATPAPYQTSTVRRGSLALSASGTGSLTAGRSVDLSFPTAGVVAQLNVAVGDTVKTGQILAVLNGQTDLQLAVENARLAVLQAQSTLDSYQSGAEANLAQALADQASAQKALTSAQENLRSKGQPRCEANVTEGYYYAYLAAQREIKPWQAALDDGNTGYGRDYLLEKLRPLWARSAQAYANYTYCQGFTTAEISMSQANLAAAQAELASASAAYQKLQANHGIDPAVLALDQAALKSAQLQLAAAQNNLAGATLAASMDGTVTAINGAVGQTTGSTAASSSSSQASSSTPLITIADVANPQVQVNFDETDLKNLAAGCPAQVTFDSVPGKTFAGKLSQILPALVSSNNVNALRGLVSLTDYSGVSVQPLPLGASASVEVTCQQANNALQVPSAALHEQPGQPAFVYVLNQSGQPEKREVQVGLNTGAFAEIRSGLQEGERVITSPVQQSVQK